MSCGLAYRPRSGPGYVIPSGAKANISNISLDNSQLPICKVIIFNDFMVSIIGEAVLLFTGEKKSE